MIRPKGPWLYIATGLSLTMTTGSAGASVQDYQIRRLLSYHSDCQVTALSLRPAAKDAARYHADCENIAFYPDGVEVECADGHDERSCHVLTDARIFRTPELLKGKPADP